ncbi:MAG: PAP2 family protein, partial [Clostridiaceae bacterium]
MYSTLVNFDGNILLFIQEYLRTPFLTPIFKFITSLGNGGAVWIVATIILLCFRKTRKAGILSAIALLLSLIIDNLL